MPRLLLLLTLVAGVLAGDVPFQPPFLWHIHAGPNDHMSIWNKDGALLVKFEIDAQGEQPEGHVQLYIKRRVTMGPEDRRFVVKVAGIRRAETDAVKIDVCPLFQDAKGETLRYELAPDGEEWTTAALPTDGELTFVALDIVVRAAAPGPQAGEVTISYLGTRGAEATAQ